MSDQLRLERHLPGLLEDLYLGGTPDYRNEVLVAVGRTRQRPAWTFPERWLPMVDIAARPAFLPRVPTRLLIVVVLLLALAVAALVAYVGNPKALPAPFGPARNGLIVYSVNGDLQAADPATGRMQTLTSGEHIDRSPTVSRDGTRIAFLRGAPGGAEDDFTLAVMNVAGGEVRILDENLGSLDALSWSPDGTFLLRNVADEEIVRYDLDTGERRVLATRAIIREEPFQPPTGALIVYESTANGRELWVMNADGSGARMVHAIPAADADRSCDFSTVRWSPDGSRIAFRRVPPDAPDQCRIFLVNADGTGERQLAATAGDWVESDPRWSPDGTMIAFNRWERTSVDRWEIRPIGVVPASGGEVRGIGPAPVSDGAAFEWSPDGGTIISVPGNAVGWAPLEDVPQMRPILIEVASGIGRDMDWSASSWPSWQRLVPEE